MTLIDLDYQVMPTPFPLLGTITVPGDKSISHRALILSAIAEGTSTISNCLMGEDNLATLLALRHLGVPIDCEDFQPIHVHGVGLHGLQMPSKPLDLGNSGTGLRLLTGLLAGQRFSSQLTGDTSLCHRPMARIVEPLTAMGARVTMTAEGTAPLQIAGGQSLTGIDYELPVASAQVKSCLLLAGLYANGRTSIHESTGTRDHTERLLQACGYPLTLSEGYVSIEGGGCLLARDLVIPGDFSSAAFFLVAALIIPGSRLTLKNVSLNPTRLGAVRILRKMGAKIEILAETTRDGEPSGDIIASYSHLRGIDIPLTEVASSIDEFPIIFIAAAAAVGSTTLKEGKELRMKESDRIETMARGLKELGISVQVFEDGLTLQGGKFRGGIIDSAKDHRVAMAFAVAGCIAEEPILIRHCANVQTSFPNFIELAQKLGIEINESRCLPREKSRDISN